MCVEAKSGPTVLKMEPIGMAFEPHVCDCDLGEHRTNVLPFMNEMSRIAHGARICPRRSEFCSNCSKHI